MHLLLVLFKIVEILKYKVGTTKVDQRFNSQVNSEFCFPRKWMFVEEKLRFEGNRINYSPRDNSLSDLLFNFAKRAEIPATTSGHLRLRVTAVNISRVIVNCFPLDVIVFTMLPAHAIWRETVLLLDVM